MPGNCKSFSDTFSLKPESLLSKEIGQQTAQPRSRKPHPLVTAYRLRELLDSGVVDNRAELVRRVGLSRAPVTQFLNLLKLPAEVRDEILGLPHERQRRFSERSFCSILRLSSAGDQLKASKLMNRL